MSAAILIVEDDPALRRGLSDRFRQDGYAVSIACDGQGAMILHSAFGIAAKERRERKEKRGRDAAFMRSFLSLRSLRSFAAQNPRTAG